MAKAAAIFVIAVVLVTAVLLRPALPPPPIAAGRLALPTVALAGLPLHPPRFRVDSEPVRNPFRARSEYEHGVARGARTNPFTEVRTAPEAAEPLVAQRLPATGDAAPALTDARSGPRPTGHLPRALETAAHHTSGALRTAARALRSVF